MIKIAESSGSYRPIRSRSSATVRSRKWFFRADPHLDPLQEITARRQRTGQHPKTTKSGANMTRRRGKYTVTPLSNIHTQEVTGSSPAVSTIVDKTCV